MIVFISHSAADYAVAAAVGRSLNEGGHEVVLSTASASPSGELRHDLMRQMLLADAVVVLLSADGSTLYELGFAEGSRLPILVAAPEADHLSHDVIALPLVRMSGDAGRDALAIAERLERLSDESSALPLRAPSADDSFRLLAQASPASESVASIDVERMIARWFSEQGIAVEDAPDPAAPYDFALQMDTGTVLVEAKRYLSQERVSAEAVHKLAAAVVGSGAAAGLLVSTAGFTAAASALAAVTPIVLRTVRELVDARSARMLLARGSEAIDSSIEDR